VRTGPRLQASAGPDYERIDPMASGYFDARRTGFLTNRIAAYKAVVTDWPCQPELAPG
jgi:hypothetical protein